MLRCSEPPLWKEGLQAGIVTAFNLTRIDTSFKTILFLPLFWGLPSHTGRERGTFLGSTVFVCFFLFVVFFFP